MAGGINPFGFAVSAPQPAPRAPIDLPSAPFGFAPPPSKWEQTAAILNEYNPIDAFWRLYNSDMAKGGAITDQNIEDGMMVGGTVMGGGAMIPKPANALNMGMKVLNESGEPLLLHHGTYEDFDNFELGNSRSAADLPSNAFYFTPDKAAAHDYVPGGHVIDAHLSIEKPLDLRTTEGLAAINSAIGNEEIRGPMYGLKLNSPLAEGNIWQQIFEAAPDQANDVLNGIVEWAKNNNYDGLIFRDGNRGLEADSYAVFEPNQITRLPP